MQTQQSPLSLPLLLVFLAGCMPLAPLPAGETGFGLLGDTPYSQDEIERLERLIDDINAQPLAFVVHVGDIGSSAQACGDEWLFERKRQFARIRHRFVLVPGDNEWSDCKQPLERLRKWRTVFCASLPETRVQQGEYCEHLRWEAGGWVFVTLNVPGNNNNLRHAEHAPRMRAVLAWLEEAAAAAERREGLVVLMQANPFFGPPRRDGFASLNEALARLAQRRPGRVILVHGDTHLYREDEPLPGLRRIEVWGSPIVSWLRASVSGPTFRVDALR